jgi:DNA-binding IclR family transcriptional regulator
MRPDECEAILHANGLRARLIDHNLSLARIRSEIEAARQNGYAFSDAQFHSGVRAVAAPIHDFRREPVAALVLAAIAARIPVRKVRSLARALKSEQVRIENEIGAPRF